MVGERRAREGKRGRRRRDASNTTNSTAMDALLAGGYVSSDEEERAKEGDRTDARKDETKEERRECVQVHPEVKQVEARRRVKVGRPTVPPKETDVHVQNVRLLPTIWLPAKDSNRMADLVDRAKHAKPLLSDESRAQTGTDFLATLPPPKQTFHSVRGTLVKPEQNDSNIGDAEAVGREPDSSPVAKSHHVSSLYRVDTDSPVEGPAVAPIGETWNGESGSGMHESDVWTSLITAEHRKINRKRKGMHVQEAPNIVEINQAELTRRPIVGHNPAEPPSTAQEMSAMRGASRPEQTTKRRHQITSLYYEAKQRELSIKENRAQGMKTRKETQAKYGW